MANVKLNENFSFVVFSLTEAMLIYAAPSSPIFPNKLPLQDPTVGQAAQILQAKYEPIFAQMRWIFSQKT